jgi:hypothetical protein
MDELEFRRRIMSDPKDRDTNIVAAINSNDSQIAKAMNVDVPEGLADKILFNNSAQIENNVVRPNFARRAMAMAASIAFVAGLLVGQINWGNIVVSPAQASLAETALSHVEHEKPFLADLDEQATNSQINAKMAPFEYKFGKEFPYHVYYLNHCGFGESNAVHILFRGEKGKVTMFLTKTATQEVSDFNKDGMTGVIVPVGDSSMIVVGDEGEDVSKISQVLQKIIKPMT